MIFRVIFGARNGHARHQSTACSVLKRPKGGDSVYERPAFHTSAGGAAAIFCKGGAAMAAASAYGFPAPVLAADPRRVRRLEVPAQGARAQSEARRRAALRHHHAARRISTCISPARSTTSAPGLHVRQSDPPRSARQRQDHHPGPGAQLGDLQGRQDLHLLPAQGRAVSRRRRADRRRREGHLRPHRQAAGRASASRAASCSSRSARSTRATSTRSNSNWPSRARPTSSCRRSPAAGTSSCARRRSRTTTTICASVVDISRHRPVPERRRVENEVWVMEKNPNYWNKGLPYLDGIEFYHVLPFSPELGSAILSGRVRLCPHHRSGHGAQGQGDAGHVDRPTTTRA